MLSLRAKTLVLAGVLMGSPVFSSYAATTTAKSQAGVEAPKAVAPSILVTLADLGHKSGLEFEGVQPSHEQTVYFQVPRDADFAGGNFHVHYTYSPLLNKHSNIRIYVNGTPRAAAELSTPAGQMMDIPLTKADFKDGLVKVQLKLALLVTDDRCLDERINGDYVHILPDTGLSYTLNAQAGTLRGAWQGLGKKVTVSLPAGNVSQDVFSAALGISNLLAREGKEANFVRLPQLGDIVVAPIADTKSALATAYPNQPIEYDVPSGKFNAGVIKAPNKRIIGVAEPFDVAPLYLVSQQWVNVAADAKYQVAPVTGSKLGEEQYSIELPMLGLDAQTRYVSRQAEWHMTFSPERLPAGYVPDRIDLEVTSTPATILEHPAMFYVYLNNVLQQAIRLENDGKPHHISVGLGKSALARHNAIRLVAQREDVQGDCHGDAVHYPVQVMPSSSLIVVRKVDEEPKQFVDLSSYFSDGFDTYLPKSYLQQPEKYLGQLTRLVHDQLLQLDYKRISFFDANAPIKPGKPFLLMDRANLDVAYAPVRFDKGSVKVVDDKGNTLLDVDQLGGIAVAQIVKSGSAYGLWVAPGQAGAGINAENYLFERDDLAFVDDSGVVLSIDSRHPGGAKVYYPGYRGWYDILSENRFWLLVAAWVLLTVIVVYLFRRNRQNRATGA